jgi:putative phosphoesterase
MRIGILSDTHDQVDRTEQALERLASAGADVFFHCGDFVEAAMLKLMSPRPCYFVFGNNDVDTAPALRETALRIGATCLDWGGSVTLAGKRIAITHGDRNSELRSLLAAEPDYLLSGHSHVALEAMHGTTRCINPGALHRAAKLTVACLDLISGELEFLEVLSLRSRVSPQKNKHAR